MFSLAMQLYRHLIIRTIIINHKKNTRKKKSLLKATNLKKGKTRLKHMQLNYDRYILAHTKDIALTYKS